MKDLTIKFASAIAIKKDSFVEMKWYSAIALLSVEINLEFIWDDIDDRWMKLGYKGVPTVMVARICPLIFLKDASWIKKFANIYKSEFVYETFSSNISKDYCIESTKLQQWFPWDGGDSWCEMFSLEDLFYETH